MRNLVRSGKVFLYGEFIGLLREDHRGFHFAYNPDYQGIPLSLSFPINSKPFSFGNLIPLFCIIGTGRLAQT